MAKRKHTIGAAILAVTGAIRTEASGTLTPEQKEKAINKAMDVLENSDAITAAEYQQEGIDRLVACEQAEILAEQEQEQEEGGII